MKNFSLADEITKSIGKNAVAIKTVEDIAPLIEKIAEAKIVMLGESTHGTHEFYEWRRLISQELIAKHGFSFIAVEGDWPPCSALNEYIHTQKKTLRQTMSHFKRWPTWMWANTETIKLAQWLQDHNKKKSGKAVGFFGLDVYSLFESINEVIHLLHALDPKLSAQAQKHYSCFDRYQNNEKLYAKSLWQFPEGCKAAATLALQELLEIRLSAINQQEKLFNIQQNARIVKNAEDYYNTLIHGDEDSWNIRDRHMMETLNILLEHHGPSSKAIVWAHNTHIGDYRATDMVKDGQINIGGLARQEWGENDVALIGFGTYHGQVIASRAWDGPIEVMNVPAGHANSYEKFFHDACERHNLNSVYLWLKSLKEKGLMTEVFGHRAIGVVYHPAFEKHGNYVPTSLSNRYDGFIFIDRTNALIPLPQDFSTQEIPETWPRGL